MVHRSISDGSGENEVLEQIVGLAEIVARIPRGAEVRALSPRQIAALDAMAMPLAELAASAGDRFAR
jgi:hypothetical protein